MIQDQKIGFEDAKDYQPEKSAHAFYKEKDQWMVYCRKTKGRFSTALWNKDVVPMKECPCCKEIVRR
jgi:hypothetical protein